MIHITMQQNAQSSSTCHNGSCFKRDPSHGPLSRWQNLEKDDEMRVNITRMIYRVLCSKTCDNDEHGEMSKSLLKMATAFEERLYQMSSSQSMYSDLSTLDSRVKILAMQIGKKIENRRQLARSDCTQGNTHVHRLDALEAKVGSKLLKEIVELVDTIEKIKLTGFLDLLQSSKGCFSQPTGKKEDSISGHHVPPQIHDIYFRTHLVAAFRKVTCKNISPSDMSSVDNVDWLSLVQTARDHVDAFQKYVYNNQSAKEKGI